MKNETCAFEHIQRLAISDSYLIRFKFEGLFERNKFIVAHSLPHIFFLHEKQPKKNRRR